MPSNRVDRGLPHGYHFVPFAPRRFDRHSAFQLALVQGRPVYNAFESKIRHLEAPALLPATRWSLLGIVRSYDDDELRLYVDGHLVQRVQTSAEFTLPGPWNAVFGNSTAKGAADNGFSGELAAAGFYKSALNEETLLKLAACKQQKHCCFGTENEAA